LVNIARSQSDRISQSRRETRSLGMPLDRPPEPRAETPRPRREPELPAPVLTAAETEPALAAALADWWRDRREPRP
jgi:hypothetical protein